MREVEFRGKTKEGDWVTGSYVYAHKWFGTGEAGYFITNIYGSERVLVIPESIGQFTGLYDKNGKEIYEGDILEYEFEDIGKQKAYVYWNEKYVGFLLEVVSENFEYTEIKKGKVIGNIYDNPEFIKEK